MIYDRLSLKVRKATGGTTSISTDVPRKNRDTPATDKAIEAAYQELLRKGAATFPGRTVLTVTHHAYHPYERRYTDLNVTTKLRAKGQIL